MVVACRRCGQEWPRDPALEVPCPVCRAPVGQRCRRPSGHGVFGGGLHAARDEVANRAGILAKYNGGLGGAVEEGPPSSTPSSVEVSR